MKTLAQVIIEESHIPDLTESQKRRLKARQEQVRQWMRRDRRKREKDGTSPPGDDLLPVGFQIKEKIEEVNLSG